MYKAIIRPEILPPFVNDNSDNSVAPTVAIKVLHPTAGENIQRDLMILKVFAKIINAIPTMQWLSLPEKVAIFGEMMQDKLDLS